MVNTTNETEVKFLKKGRLLDDLPYAVRSELVPATIRDDREQEHVWRPQSQHHRHNKTRPKASQLRPEANNTHTRLQPGIHKRTQALHSEIFVLTDPYP